MYKKIFFNSTIYVIGPQLPKIFGLFLLPFLTPYLTVKDYAVFGIVTAYTLIFSTSRDLGMSLILMNAFFKIPNRWKIVWRQIFSYLLIWGLLLAAIQALLLYFVIPSEAKDLRYLIILLFSLQCLLFEVPILLGIRYYQLVEKPIYVSVISTIPGLIGLGLQYYFIAIEKYGYLGWFFSTFISLGIMASIYFTILVFHLKIIPIFKIKKARLMNSLKIALPMLPHSYSSYLLNTSDRAMLSLFKVPMGLIGVYNVAYTFGNYLEGLGSAVGVAVGPTYMRMFSQKGSDGSDVIFFTNILQLIFTVVTFILALWSKELFNVMFNNDLFADAYVIGIIIIMSYSYRPLYWAIVGKLQYDDRTSILWKITFGAGVANVILNAICIPIWGIYAAAFTTFFALLLQAFSGYFIVKVLLPMLKSTLYLWLIFILGLTLIAFLLKDSNNYIKVIITIISFFLALFFVIKRIKLDNGKHNS